MAINIFHNEKAKQINFLDNRYYSNDNVTFFPSVTTILDIYPKGFGFLQWVKDVGNAAAEIAERAAKIGTKIHNTTELMNDGVEITWCDENGTAKFTKEEWQMLLRYARFWELCKPELIANEKNFCSPDLRFGGTLDRVVMINGVRWLIDIKTSNYLHKGYELQLSAYAMLWNESNPDAPIEKTGIMWLKASTRTEKIDYKKDIVQGFSWQLATFERPYQDAFRVFLHTQAIWEEENPNYKPANMVYPDSIKL